MKNNLPLFLIAVLVALAALFLPPLSLEQLLILPPLGIGAAVALVLRLRPARS